MRSVALALAMVACGAAREPPTVTVEPLPPARVESSAAPLPPVLRTTAPAAPEVLAPGKVTVIHFFATWCFPCKKSLPALEAIYEARRPRVATVFFAEDDEAQGIREFVTAAGATLDAKWDVQKTHAAAWHVETMPSTYVVDKYGGLRFRHAGWHDADEVHIAREVDELLRDP